MYRSRKVKLYLTKEQDKLLLHQLGIARWTYNHFLALRIRYYKIYGNARPSEVSLLANSNSLMGWGSPLHLLGWRECKTECGYAASGNSL